MTIIKHLGMQDYVKVWKDMQDFTAKRDINTEDELWLLEHFSVYTQGQAGKEQYILQRNAIPIIHTDRGGQITYHGPGQMIGYTLIDLERKKLGIKTLVCKLEKIIIKLLNYFDIEGHCLTGAPGVYVDNSKIASIGLRVKQGRTYHGIALNINMDLNPFNDITPCGLANMQMTKLENYISNITMETAMEIYSRLYQEELE